MSAAREGCENRRSEGARIGGVGIAGSEGVAGSEVLRCGLRVRRSSKTARGKCE
jgi:hypothetical protein